LVRARGKGPAPAARISFRGAGTLWTGVAGPCRTSEWKKSVSIEVPCAPKHDTAGVFGAGLSLGVASLGGWGLCAGWLRGTSTRAAWHRRPTEGRRRSAQDSPARKPRPYQRSDLRQPTKKGRRTARPAGSSKRAARPRRSARFRSRQRRVLGRSDLCETGGDLLLGVRGPARLRPRTVFPTDLCLPVHDSGGLGALRTCGTSCEAVNEPLVRSERRAVPLRRRAGPAREQEFPKLFTAWPRRRGTVEAWSGPIGPKAGAREGRAVQGDARALFDHASPGVRPDSTTWSNRRNRLWLDVTPNSRTRRASAPAISRVDLRLHVDVGAPGRVCAMQRCADGIAAHVENGWLPPATGTGSRTFQERGPRRGEGGLRWTARPRSRHEPIRREAACRAEGGRHVRRSRTTSVVPSL